MNEPEAARVTDDEKAEYERERRAEYRRTHSREGSMLGTPEYPDNREGRRALARTWKRAQR